MADRIETRLANGMLAHINEDRWQAGAYELVVDGTPQSHVDLDNPSRLFFEYVQRIGHVIDAWGEPGQPVTALHLGAGAMTLPRYIHATRPGSRQQVVELERELVDFVRAHLPLPKGASIRVRYGDARETLAQLPAGLRGQVDIVVVDVFGGARIPAHVTSVEFYEEVRALLAPGGIVAVNIADGPGLAFARAQAATLRYVFADVIALAESGVLKSRRFGNVVMAAGVEQLPVAWLPRLLAGGPHPASVLGGDELTKWIAGAPVATDATAVPSPPPSKSVFSTR
ncbi:MAG TPA: fused MFS/spermidine synthase [Microcella sp.]|nr:fused MFS/spermidine synthase [Microcella sp.]